MATTQEREGRVLQVGEELKGICCGWLNVGHGYGFIRVEGVTKDLFVPSRNLRDATFLQRGDCVSFEVRMGRDGRLMADLVERVGHGRQVAGAPRAAGAPVVGSPNG